MVQLQRIWKDKVINHHNDVPYKVLNRSYSFGEENSWNKIIHGDNLEALKSLLPQYEWRIDCIYIDPPYNTGNEGRIYNDNVNDPKIQKWLHEKVWVEWEDLSRHDKWLCMMYPRLKLLQKLLSDNWAIFISIDDNEQANLKLLCDEIFWINNFVWNIHWKRSESQNNSWKLLATVWEFIVCYLKNKTSNSTFNKIDLSEKAEKEYRYEDEYWKFRRWTIVDNSRGKNILELESPKWQKREFKCIRTLEFIQEKQKENLIYWTETGTPYLKIYLEKSEWQISSNWFDNVWVNEDAKENLNNIWIPFDFSKPYKLVERIINLCCDKNSIILDSFAWSWTTGHAVLDLNKDWWNRKFILIELWEYADNITAERIKKIINWYSYNTKKNNKITNVDIEWLWWWFDFYELWEPLFFNNEYLNERIPTEVIKEYIRYSETKSDIQPNNTNNEYYLWSKYDTDYYFYYKKEETTTLDKNFLSGIEKNNNHVIIYADKCYLSKEFMLKNWIVFKKIPRDISRF